MPSLAVQSLVEQLVAHVVDMSKLNIGGVKSSMYRPPARLVDSPYLVYDWSQAHIGEKRLPYFFGHAAISGDDFFDEVFGFRISKDELAQRDEKVIHAVK